MSEEIKRNRMPDPLATFEEKLTDEYAHKVAEFISGEWFNGGFIEQGCEYTLRRDYIRNKRLFFRGEMEDTYFKNAMKKGDNDLDLYNVDWKDLNQQEKFARSVINGLNTEYYKIDIRSIDPFTKIKQLKKRDVHKKDMVIRELAEKFSQETGVDVRPKGFVPDDEEELELLMELKERPKIEIGERILINSVKKFNKYDIIEQRIREDAVVTGLIVSRVYIDPNDGVKVSYVNPEFYIHSKCENKDFSDKYYEGYIETITLSDIRRETNWDDVKLRKVAETYSRSNNKDRNYVSSPELDDLLDYKIDVLRYAWKTSKTLKYKVKLKDGKSIKAQKRDEKFSGNEKEKKDFKELSKTLDTWLEGTYIIGTKFVYGHKESENIEQDVMNKAYSPFITFAYDMYENRLRSFMSNLEGPALHWQKAHIKLQHLLSELRPDVIEIDLDLLAEIDDGKGGSKRQAWQSAFDMFTVKGIALTKRVNMGTDGIKDSSALKQYPSPSGNQIAVLLNAMQYYYSLMRENTGVNPAKDGTMPASTLVGVAKMQELASNTITRGIVEMVVNFNKQVAEVISSRILTIFKYKEGSKLRKMYENMVSKELLDAQEVLANRHLNEFGFFIEMMPGEEELQEFNEILNMGIQEGSIDPEIVIEARSLAKSDMKFAMRYLGYTRRKRMKQKQEEQMALIDRQSQSNAQASQVAEQAKAQSYQMQRQVDLQYESQLAQITVMKERAIKEANLPFDQREFEQDVYLEKIKYMGKIQNETFKEDRKDSRVDKQSTNQSKLLEQRNNDSGAIDFEKPELNGLFQ
tara:strand:+ start:7819 stop:10227 length:2409 start_codon:yes stop_codon:yes gene_type:complete